MASQFAMRIVHLPSGEYVEWAPGQVQEALIVEELVDRVKAKGVGLFRTEAHVLVDVEAAMTELIFDLKSKV